MLFARLVLLVQALVWGALGVLYWVRPYEMANLSGMLLMEDSAVSDARVFYGGHQFALALFLLFALRRASLVQPALTQEAFDRGVAQLLKGFPARQR